MSQNLPTTPPSEPEYTAAEFKDKLHSALRSRSLEILNDYIDAVHAGGTLAEKHRYLEWATKTLGAEAEKSKTGNGFATVNISIGVGGAISSTVVEVVQEVEAPGEEHGESESPHGEVIDMLPGPSQDNQVDFIASSFAIHKSKEMEHAEPATPAAARAEPAPAELQDTLLNLDDLFDDL